MKRKFAEKEDAVDTDKDDCLDTFLSINDLPNELLVRIFSYIDKIYLCTVCVLVCSTWRDIIYEPTLWTTIQIPAVRDKSLQGLEAFFLRSKSLRSVILKNVEVQPERCIVWFSPLTLLRRLEVHSYKNSISDLLCTISKEIPGLKELLVSEAPLYRPLKFRTRLKVLNALKNLKSLTLILTDTFPNYEELINLSECCKYLEHIHILQDQDKTLHTVSLNQKDINLVILPVLKNLRNKLKHIYIPELTIEALEELSKSPVLESVSFGEIHFSLINCKNLKTLKNLKSAAGLKVDSSETIHKILSPSQLNQLTHLRIIIGFDEGYNLKEIINHCQNLQFLFLFIHGSHENIHLISKLNHLQYLYIESHAQTEEDVVHMSKLFSCFEVESIVCINLWTWFTDSLAHLIVSCCSKLPNLIDLSLKQSNYFTPLNNEVSGSTLSYLIQKCTKLEHLELDLQFESSEFLILVPDCLKRLCTLDVNSRLCFRFELEAHFINLKRMMPSLHLCRLPKYSDGHLKMLARS